MLRIISCDLGLTSVNTLRFSLLSPVSINPHFSAKCQLRFMSTFDTLMSGTRQAAASEKKTQIQTPLPSAETRKTSNPKSENPNPNSRPPQKSLETKRSPDLNIESNGMTKELRNPSSKKANTVHVDDFVAQLKKKPAKIGPKMAAWWEDGERGPFLFLAKAFDLIKDVSGRIVITDITCNLLTIVISKTPEDLLGVVYLLANKIAPAHEGVELAVGDASLIKALAEACGATEAVVKKL